MVLVNDLKPGASFKYKDNIYTVLDISRNKTARGQMVIKTKVKNLRSGSNVEISYTAGDKVESVYLDKKEMSYLYDDGDYVVFMDNKTYEQVSILKSTLEWEMKFLTPNSNAIITYYESEVIGVELPSKVILEIIECAPAVRGDTVNKAMKDAILETGLKVKVPMFIEQNEKIIIKTESGEYDSRA